MTWKDWIPHRPKAKEPKVQGPAPKLPLPRSVESQGQPPMLLPMGDKIVEVVSVLHSDEPWLDGSKAGERIPLDRCAGKVQADMFSVAHHERLWPTFAGHTEVRLLFLGTSREDSQGFLWVPCIRMTGKGFTLSMTWVVNPRSGSSNLLTQNDLVALLLA